MLISQIFVLLATIVTEGEIYSYYFSVCDSVNNFKFLWLCQFLYYYTTCVTWPWPHFHSLHTSLN